MPSRDPANWMLSEALDALSRAERMHRQFFQIHRSSAALEPSWEPPIDVL
jgi:HSP20 family protein